MSECELDACRLETLEKVGSGVTAVVYRGMMDGRIEVAIKEIEWHKAKMNDRQQVAFDREVAIMAKVRHPNLVNFFGVVSVSKPFKIVTEYCGGGCAFELLHNDEDVVLAWPQVHKMCLDVAKAIEYLHSFNPKIIHRDLKSLNLLLLGPVKTGLDMPFVKVSDFGLSRMQTSVNGENGWGKLTQGAGTSHWMAPEVHTDCYDERVDVYSYAMIMYEIVCREIPFEDEEAASVGRIIAQGHRPDLEAVPPDAPFQIQSMVELMQRCWAQSPDARPSFRDIVPFLAQFSAQLWPGNWPRD